eukprot:GHVH01001166.1.p1 GENE.GHVH01001166.1~~GHVH01001166.1.p1  ORF type:complete len:178 (-),score=31.38 GHVH01001166.1:45-578(-)
MGPGRSKSTLTTTVLQLRELFLDFVNPNIPLNERPTITSLVLQFAVLHDKIVEQYPVIPTYAQGIATMSSILDNGHRVEQHIEGIASKANYVATNEKSLDQMVNYVNEMKDLYHLLDSEGIERDSLLLERVVELKNTVSVLNHRADQMIDTIERDLLRFSLAERCQTTVLMVDRLKK